MAQFGNSDAFFGLGEADAPVAKDDGEGFDLDRDDVTAAPAEKAFDMGGLDDALPGGGMGGGMGMGGMGGMVRMNE